MQHRVKRTKKSKSEIQNKIISDEDQKSEVIKVKPVIKEIIDDKLKDKTKNQNIDTNKDLKSKNNEKTKIKQKTDEIEKETNKYSKTEHKELKKIKVEFIIDKEPNVDEYKEKNKEYLLKSKYTSDISGKIVNENQ